jgi:hypothetical protein
MEKKYRPEFHVQSLRQSIDCIGETIAEGHMIPCILRGSVPEFHFKDPLYTAH